MERWRRDVEACRRAWRAGRADYDPGRVNAMRCRRCGALACIGCGEVWPLRSALSCPACGDLLVPVWMEDPPCGPATMEEVRDLLRQAGVVLDDGDEGAVVPDRAECVARGASRRPGTGTKCAKQIGGRLRCG